MQKQEHWLDCCSPNAHYYAYKKGEVGNNIRTKECLVYLLVVTIQLLSGLVFIMYVVV